MKKRILSVLMCVVLIAAAAAPAVSAADSGSFEFPDAGILLGDANLDGNVNIIDATLIQRTLASIDFDDEFSEKAADVDRDGGVMIVDATWIQRYCAGMNTPEGIGKPLSELEPIPIEHKLVSSVEVYNIGYYSGDWEFTHSTSFTYENAYPVKIEDLDGYDGAEPITTTFEYTFDGDKPVKRVQTDLVNDIEITADYNNGRVYNYHAYHSQGGSYENQMFQYGNGDEYFTMVLHDDLMSGGGYGPDIMKEEVDSVTVTTENGLLKRTTNTGIYTKWAEGEQKKWVRFRGIYSIDYDSDGLASVLSAVYSDMGYDMQGWYEVKKKNGVITEIVKYNYRDGDWEPFEKYVFDYTDIEISPARYSLMMNYFITGHGGNYYYYNWY